MKQALRRFYSENKGFILFLVLMSVFRSSLADWNVVPTGSMKPGIIEGDRILVNKVAYDLRVPFSHIRIAHYADPKAGDIVIFDSKVSDKRLVKRVVGVPGDIVAMRNNQLSVNGRVLSYNPSNDPLTLEAGFYDVIEQRQTREYTIRVNAKQRGTSNFDPVRVPNDAYLVLGDNRDNSVDSRYIGFVPRDEIIGRTQRIVMSLNRENYYLPRKQRFLKPL